MNQRHHIVVNVSGLLTLAFMALVFGIIFYWLFRPTGSAAFLALLPAPPFTLKLAVFIEWLGWLPTFLHVLAFSLLSYIVLGNRYALFCCLLWGSVNAFFEIGQGLPSELIRLLPDIPYLQSYLIGGVFDPLDFTACVVASLVAWILLITYESTTGGN